MFSILEEIIAFLTLLFTLLITILTFWVKWRKIHKEKEKAKMLNLIQRQIAVYIEQAEYLVGFSGREKKKWVINKIRDFGTRCGIRINGSITEFSVDEKTVSDMIESYIDFSKKVNNKK